MDGVTIVETIAKPLIPLYGIVFLCVFGLVLLILLTLSEFFEYNREERKWKAKKPKVFDIVLYVLMTVFISAFVYIFIMLYVHQPTYYKVIVDSNVSFVEFMNAHNVIAKQDGFYIVSIVN